MSRPWVRGHSYNYYAYDPVSKPMVSSHGYLYDPDRMDWLRIPRLARPYRIWSLDHLAETTPYGVVVWAPREKGGD
jgi:hypothetical protein